MTVTLTGDDARLDYLVNVEGIDQATAASMLWGRLSTRVPEPPTYPATREQNRAWIRAVVKRLSWTVLGDVHVWLAGGAA